MRNTTAKEEQKRAALVALSATLTMGERPRQHSRHNGNIVITPIITKQGTMENTGQSHSSWFA